MASIIHTISCLLVVTLWLLVECMLPTALIVSVHINVWHVVFGDAEQRTNTSVAVQCANSRTHRSGSYLRHGCTGQASVAVGVWAMDPNTQHVSNILPDRATITATFSGAERVVLTVCFVLCAAATCCLLTVAFKGFVPHILCICLIAALW